MFWIFGKNGNFCYFNKELKKLESKYVGAEFEVGSEVFVQILEF